MTVVRFYGRGASPFSGSFGWRVFACPMILAMKNTAFILFVSGNTARNAGIYRDVQLAVQTNCPEQGGVALVDVLEDPRIAAAHDILVTPTLLNVSNTPTKRVVGDLTDMKQLTAWLQQWAPKDISMTAEHK